MPETPRVVKRIRGKKLPPNTKYVGRGSRWGNPYKIPESGFRSLAVWAFEQWLKKDDRMPKPFPIYADQRERLLSGINELKGFNLACWCHDWDGQGENPRYCHADILLEIANSN